MVCQGFPQQHAPPFAPLFARMSVSFVDGFRPLWAELRRLMVTPNILSTYLHCRLYLEYLRGSPDAHHLGRFFNNYLAGLLAVRLGVGR